MSCKNIANLRMKFFPTLVRDIYFRWLHTYSYNSPLSLILAASIYSGANDGIPWSGNPHRSEYLRFSSKSRNESSITDFVSFSSIAKTCGWTLKQVTEQIASDNTKTSNTFVIVKTKDVHCRIDFNWLVMGFAEIFNKNQKDKKIVSISLCWGI